jgi:hypothetical protein
LQHDVLFPVLVYWPKCLLYSQQLLKFTSMFFFLWALELAVTKNSSSKTMQGLIHWTLCYIMLCVSLIMQKNKLRVLELTLNLLDICQVELQLIMTL